MVYSLSINPWKKSEDDSFYNYPKLAGEDATI